MKRKITAITLAVVLLSGAMSAPARAAQTNPFANIPVVGSIVGGGTFSGVLNVTQFIARGGVLYAVGTLTGTLTSATGVVSQIINFPINLPLTSTQGTTCQVLHLELGPLDLNLLGLVVHLDKVVLDIDAQSGPGNLLGNLLCAVANLLNGNASQNAIANLLNRLLGLLG